MGVARWLTIVLVAAVALTGCARSPGATTLPASKSTSPAPPAPSDSAAGTEPIRYACTPGHASFTIEDIENAPAADGRADTAFDLLQAIAREQGGLEESALAVDGWRRVFDGREEVVFLLETPGNEAPYRGVHVVAGDVGAISRDGWAVDSYGACTPRPQVPDEVSVAKWWVDQSAETVGPETESMTALVHEQACASGQSADGRILPPTIVYGQTEVTITMIVRRIGGDAECPGNPLTPYTIELDEPLGGRTLSDGGQFPLGDPLEAPER